MITVDGERFLIFTKTITDSGFDFECKGESQRLPATQSLQESVRGLQNNNNFVEQLKDVFGTDGDGNLWMSTDKVRFAKSPNAPDIYLPSYYVGMDMAPDNTSLGFAIDALLRKSLLKTEGSYYNRRLFLQSDLPSKYIQTEYSSLYFDLRIDQTFDSFYRNDHCISQSQSGPLTIIGMAPGSIRFDMLKDNVVYSNWTVSVFDVCMSPRQTYSRLYPMAGGSRLTYENTLCKVYRGTQSNGWVKIFDNYVTPGDVRTNYLTIEYSEADSCMYFYSPLSGISVFEMLKIEVFDNEHADPVATWYIEISNQEETDHWFRPDIQ